MKQFTAILAALVITSVIAFGMFSIGANALTNKNTVPLASAPAGSTSTTGNSSQDSTQTQVQQLQSLVSQYQSREQQYQSQLNQLEQQVSRDNQQLQSYQQLLMVLQSRGVIAIRGDGTILIP
jgi:peptidoglycan hydrolase CwlO-like protein